MARKKASTSCRYCLYFHESNEKEVRRDLSGKKIIYSKRKCSETGSWIDETNDICTSFKITKRFWCEESVCWINTIVCIHRRKTKKCKKSCRQGISIELSIRENKIRETFKRPEIQVKQNSFRKSVTQNKISFRKSLSK